VPLHSNLIAYSSHAAEVKEWFYYPDASNSSDAAGNKGAQQPQQQEERLGPISKDELKMHCARGKV
jgi:hypothetical protein